MEKLLTTEDVGELLGVHRETVLRYARAGQLPAIRLARYWRFKPEDVDRFLEEHRREPATQ